MYYLSQNGLSYTHRGKPARQRDSKPAKALLIVFVVISQEQSPRVDGMDGTVGHTGY